MYIFLIIIVVFAVSFVIFSDIKKKKAKITTQNKNRIGSHKKTAQKTTFSIICAPAKRTLKILHLLENLLV